MKYNGCNGCQHYQWDGKCPSFAKGSIPMEILSGDFIHTKRHPNQKGDQLWEARTPERQKEIKQQFAEHMTKKQAQKKDSYQDGYNVIMSQRRIRPR